MQYRQLGKSGVRVSVIGLGTNRFGFERMPQDEVTRVIDGALDLGINFLDSADIYQAGRSEETIGVALQGKRSRFVVATKYFNRMGEGPNDWGASRYHLYDAVEASLRRLRTDHIDLYYVHNFDDATPIEEMLRGLDDLVRAGKVRYIGASNFLAWQIARSNLMPQPGCWIDPILPSGRRIPDRQIPTQPAGSCRVARGIKQIRARLYDRCQLQFHRASGRVGCTARSHDGRSRPGLAAGSS
jgi:aryl-alcohol dehydrogenase-like predicted oxidoreductase